MSLKTTNSVRKKQFDIHSNNSTDKIKLNYTLHMLLAALQRIFSPLQLEFVCHYYKGQTALMNNDYSEEKVQTSKI